MSTIDDIKSRIDIVDLVSETVKLRHAGKNYTGFCPFHPNSKTPAFVVFPDSGTWRCFGQCNEGGDIFKFVMKKEGWDFSETLKYLAQRAGVELQSYTQQSEADRDLQVRLHSLLEEAALFYRHQLLNTPAGKPALDYIHKRGLTDATIEKFMLGYAPDSFEATSAYLTAKGYTQAELVATGMVTERDSGGFYDRFRHRITFPIRDAVGKMSGFGARILRPDDVPKFLNSPQTELFDKSGTLYGLDQARKAIRTADQVVIVEGYLDVIALHQGGFTNTVSPMGTALTETQLRILKKFTRRFVLALDPDAAGQKATLRGLELARQTLDRTAELSYDLHGLLRQEARLQADIRVTTLPEGMDPDEVVLRNPQEWTDILAAAKPVVEHVMESLAAGQNLDDPKVKNEIAAQVLPLINDIPGSIERDTYLQKLARLLRVNEEVFQVKSVGARAASRPRPRQINPVENINRQEAKSLRQGNFTTAAETYLLSRLVDKPDLLYLINRKLKEQNLERVNSEEFTASEDKMIFGVIEDALDQSDEEPVDYLRARVPSGVAERLAELQAEKKDDKLDQDTIIGDLTRRVLDIRLHRLNDILTQMRFMLEDAQKNGDMRDLLNQEQILQLSKAKDLLTKALGNLTKEN
jgi:DNA primase